MIDYFVELNIVTQVVIATLFTWGMTALGAAVVFTSKNMNQKFLDGMLGFAGGVMIAASFWSLLAPALEMAEDGPFPNWIPAAIGFLLGGLFFWGVDKVIPHLHPPDTMESAEGLNLRKRNEVHCSCLRSHCITYQKGSRLALHLAL